MIQKAAERKLNGKEIGEKDMRTNRGGAIGSESEMVTKGR